MKMEQNKSCFNRSTQNDNSLNNSKSECVSRHPPVETKKRNFGEDPVLRSRLELQACVRASFAYNISLLSKKERSLCGRLPFSVCDVPIQRVPEIVALNIAPLIGLPKPMALTILQIVVCDYEDRCDLIRAFNVNNNKGVPVRHCQYVLIERGVSRRVNKKTFCSVSGKCDLLNGVYTKVVFDAHSLSGLSNVIAGVRKVLKILSLLGEKEATTIDFCKPGQICSVLLDLLKLCKNGFDYMNVASLLLSVYNLVTSSVSFVAHGLDTVALSALTLLLPKELFEILRRINVLTSAKVLDDVSIFSSVFNLILDFVKKCVVKLPESVSSVLVPLLEKLPFGEQYQYLARAEKLLLQWKDKRIVAQESFRTKVKELAPLMRFPALVEWSRRSPAVKAVIDDFGALVKSVAGYDSARRVEPACFVFEGPAGCFKTVIMNQLIEVLQKNSVHPRTVYCHSMRAVKDGKDFYDTYNNEDVFFMDDLGQQGVSQYRSMINWVSESKYPLDCAEVTLKNTKFFCSSLIMFTTNQFSTINSFTKDDCISCPSALWRRGYVFDFSTVVRVGDQLSGRIAFKYYDPILDQWIQGFPPGVELSMDTSVETASDRRRVLAWMYKIVNAIETSKQQFAEANTINAVQADQVVEMAGHTKYFDFELPSLHFSEWSKWLVDNITTSFLDCWDFATFCPLNMSLTVVCGLCLVGLVSSLVVFFQSSSAVAPDTAAELKQLLKELPSVTDHSSVVSFVKKQVVFLTIYGSTSESSTTALISGHCVIIPSHATNARTIVVSATSESGSTGRVLDHVTLTRVYLNPRADVAIYTMDRTIIQPFKNLATKIACASSYDYLVTSDKVVPVSGGHINDTGLHYTSYNVFQYVNDVAPGQCYDYGFSAPGLCGSVLVSNKTGICGMHVAGKTDGTAGSAIIWSERVISDIVSILKCDTKYLIDLDFEDLGEDSSGLSLDAPYRVSVPMQSKLVPSPLVGILPNSKRPANLSVFGAKTVDVLAKKSFKPLETVDERDVEFAKDWLDMTVQDYSPLSLREAILGTKDLAALNKKSSNGYGYEPGKEVYVDFEKGELTALGQQEYDRVLDSICSGDVDPKDFLWTECLKDELRLEEKVNKPRTFRCCSVIMQIITKQVFGNMVAQVQNDKWSNGIMIGINPLADFDRIYRELDSCKLKWGGDFPTWDGKMSAQLQEGSAEVLSRKCTDARFRLVARFVLYNMSHALVLVRKNLWQTTHSLPSGSFLTAIVNSMINRMTSATWFSWVCRCVGIEPTLSLFLHVVKEFDYGDDKTVGIKEYVEYFNMRTMAEFYNQIGIGFTNSRKEQIKKDGETWEEITFLKREFVFSPKFNKIVCPLAPETIFSTLSWLDKTKDCNVVLHDKLAAFQREAYLHPTYKVWMLQLNEGLQKRGIEHQFLPEHSLDLLVKRSDKNYYLQPYAF